MLPDTISARLTGLLAEVLPRPVAKSVSEKLVASGQGPHAVDLLSELAQDTRKVAAATIEILPDVLAVLPEAELITWLDLIVSLSERSGAAGLKLCQESRDLFDNMSVSARVPAMRVALELTEQDASMALEALRHAGRVVQCAGLDVLPIWAEIGADLAKSDYALGIEFFQHGPEILSVLPVSDLTAWGWLSVKLVTPNSFGKPDYIAALTYLRTSPSLLGELKTADVRRWALTVAAAFANRSPDRAIEFLGEMPGWFRRISDPEWQTRVLQCGTLLAEADADAALAYFRRAPEMFELMDAAAPSSTDRFDEWYRGGMEILAYSPEGARAYFAVETRKALDAVERAASGLSVREVSRMLKLFAEALSGRSVTIMPIDAAGHHASSRVSSDRALLFLPARIGLHPTREQNFRVYKLLTAHEAGHLQYGTYDLDLAHLQDLAVQASLRYGAPVHGELTSLEALFRLYPNPLLIRDLWMLAEDARIEASLKAEYPGLCRDMEMVIREELSARSLAHGMTARELVVEFLLRLSTGEPDQVDVPSALEGVVSRAWALLQAVAQPGVTAEDVLRTVHRTYVLIEELTAPETEPSSNENGAPEPDRTENPHAGQQQGGAYQPLVNFSFRGDMDAERVHASADRSEQTSAEQPMAEGVPDGDDESAGADHHAGSRAVQHDRVPSQGSTDAGNEGRAISAAPAEAPFEGLGGTLGPGEGKAYLYDEWDAAIRDYRVDWCRVVEETAREGSEALVHDTRALYGGIVTLLRRYFEGIRPPGLRRVRRQADGEDVDLEAAIEEFVERQVSASPSEFVYIRRDRKQRDVAAAFLVDLSGSTSRQIGPDGTRIIDVQKEGVVLLCEALEAVGDHYAVYGYSGRSRRDVRFLILKDFGERYGPEVWRRLDAVRPMVQNRDGAAIRHALHKLRQTSNRVKLMVLLSDGRPLDDLYTDEYALEDTKVALREAKAEGVHVFCITVDQEAPEYLVRMYGDVSYVIIDRVETLPERLPRIYRMLTT